MLVEPQLMQDVRRLGPSAYQISYDSVTTHYLYHQFHSYQAEVKWVDISVRGEPVPSTIISMDGGHYLESNHAFGLDI